MSVSFEPGRSSFGRLGYAPLIAARTSLHLICRGQSKTFILPEVEVPVGLSDKEKYRFPARFQSEYGRHSDRDESFIFCYPVPPGEFNVNGEEIGTAGFNGFSREATHRYHDQFDQNAGLCRIVKDEMSISLPNLSPGSPGPSGYIDNMADSIDRTLKALGLSFHHDWGGPLPDHYISYFSFIPAFQPEANLLGMAVNCCRLKQLVSLLKIAYRGNVGERNSRLNGIVTKNIEARKQLNPIDAEPGGEAEQIEALDLDLRVELLKEIGRRRASNYVPWGGYKNPWRRHSPMVFRQTGKRPTGSFMTSAEAPLMRQSSKPRKAVSTSLITAATISSAALTLIGPSLRNYWFHVF